SVILIEQLRTIDKMRLKEKICTVNYITMQKVDVAILISLGITI
ncbi:MAG: type II toxin-antitoxin system PemK/MazF family toxin, partial [Clostridia bacterium]|nr:type II toxin-antitoxin system PemK/MazF family toxin [Clostridia bacterium]